MQFLHRAYSWGNKALMSNLGFPFATTFTSWHLMVTFCTLHVANRLNFFESKLIDMKTVMLFGILNGVSIGLLNLSLGFNSVGFYQMTKIAIIPFTVLVETLFLKKQFDQPADQVCSLPITCWSWHCLYDRSPAQFFWNHSLPSSHRNNLCWPNSNKHDTEEAQCFFYPATLPVSSFSSSYSFHHRTCCRSVPDQAKCLLPQILPHFLGIHHTVLPNSRVCELQHFFGDWQDITSDI